MKKTTHSIQNKISLHSIAILLTCSAILTGCNKTVNKVLSAVRGSTAAGAESSEEDWEAVKLNKETRYYNDYHDYNYSAAWLMFSGNLERSDLNNHLGFDLDVRSLDGINDIDG